MSVQYQAVKGWQMSHRFSPYSGGGSNRFKPFSSSQCAEPTAYGGLTATSTYDPYQNTTSSCAWVRPTYAPQYSLAFADETASHYSAQAAPPSYMLPNTDPMNNINSCYLNSNLGRPQQTSLWTDSVTSSLVAPTMTSNGGHVNTAYGLQDNATSFHAVNTSSTDRILPTPSASRTLAGAPQSSLDSQCLSALSHRSSLGWTTETSSSTSGLSSRTSNSTDSDRVVSAGPFGYVDMSSNAQELADTTSGIEISQSPNDARRSSDDSCVQIGSHDGHRLGQSPSNLMNYPYASGRSIGNHHSATGRLISGQVYHPVPISSNTRSSIQQDCSPTLQEVNHEATWQTHSQRSSVASLSNSSGFNSLH